MKQNFILLVSIGIGLLAALLTFFWLRSKEADYEKEMKRLYANAEKISVVVAARPLPSGTVIQASDIGMLSVFATSVTDDNIQRADAARIVGRTLLHSLDMHNPILWTYIDGGKQQGRNLSDDIKEKMRAVSIPVSGASGVSGMVRPNDSVDVLGSFVLPASSPATDASELEMVTLTVLQNVTILAIGSDTQRTIAERRNNSGYNTVTLQVTPREAEMLVFAQQMKGKLFLTLRNPSDVYYENELPRVDFTQIERELKSLNEHRQQTIRRVPLSPR